jgi:hypothetical protein
VWAPLTSSVRLAAAVEFGKVDALTSAAATEDDELGARDPWSGYPACAVVPSTRSTVTAAPSRARASPSRLTR